MHVAHSAQEECWTHPLDLSTRKEDASDKKKAICFSRACTTVCGINNSWRQQLVVIPTSSSDCVSRYFVSTLSGRITCLSQNLAVTRAKQATGCKHFAICAGCRKISNMFRIAWTMNYGRAYLHSQTSTRMTLQMGKKALCALCKASCEYRGRRTEACDTV
eukprot:TRINITY_DN57855_c0_g1_i1.p1 TRINITY_DN57855_c0_g1~~TRINITY_DN57855_c0_g1_i1.p1  ORF type:complete len:161 (+),score=1.28 TRINITY_DN57855_c0_g1_i1:255-737(+)